MGTHERRHFFERICELRARYAALGDEDRMAETSLDEAVALMAAALAAEADALEPAAALVPAAAEPVRTRSDYLN